MLDTKTAGRFFASFGLLLAVGMVGSARGQDARTDRESDGQVPVHVPAYFEKLGPLGEESPRQLAERFVRGLIKGDRDLVVSCFQLDTLEDLSAAAMYGETSHLAAKSGRFQREVHAKFGNAGLRAVQKHTGMRFVGEQPLGDGTDVDELLSRMEVITEEEKSVARFPNPLRRGECLDMERANGRWYVRPSGSDEKAGPMAAMLAMSVRRFAEQVDQLRQLVGESETLEEFDKNLENLRGIPTPPSLSADSAAEKPLYSDSEVVIEKGESASSTSFPGNLSGAGSDGYTVSWAFTGRSSFGDVYVIQIKTPEGKRAPEAILYQGGEKVLYDAENGNTRILLRPNSSH